MRAFLLTFLFALNSWASGPRCASLFQHDYKALNPTAQLTPENYRLPNTRRWSDYVQLLFTGFNEARSVVRDGAVVVDLGGGQGRAMADLATSRPVIAVVVNTQDFSGQFPSKPGLGRLHYLTGWAEEALKALRPNSVDLTFDVFGAFHYSSRKDLLVEGIYRALKPGGSARLLFDFQNSLAFVGKVRLDRWLEARWPDVFSVRLILFHGRPVSILTITKPATQASSTTLALNLDVERSDTNPRLPFAVPRVWYRERN